MARLQAAQLFLEIGAVVQPGEGVVGAEVLQLLLRFFALARIPDALDGAQQDPAGTVNRRRQGPEIEPLATVSVRGEALGGDDLTTALDPFVLLFPLPAVAEHEIDQKRPGPAVKGNGVGIAALPEYILFPDPRHLLGGPVPDEHFSFPVDDQGCVREMVENLLQKGYSFRQLMQAGNSAAPQKNLKKFPGRSDMFFRKEVYKLMKFFSALAHVRTPPP